MSFSDLSSEGSSLLRALFFLAALAPGFLISLIRSYFTTGRRKAGVQFVGEYVVISAVYYSFAVPFLVWTNAITPLSLMLLFFWAPIALGAVFGAIYQWNALAFLWPRLRVRPVHSAPTAWDYVFGMQRSECWIIVTLKDDRKIYGLFGGKSLASSELGQRDIFIQDLRGQHFAGLEPDGRAHGLWINEGEIAMIEFIADE